MSEWKEYKLGDIATFSQGLQVSVPQQFKSYSEGMVRFIRIVDVTQNDPNDIRYIPEPDKKYILKKGEIAMLRYANPGLVTDSFEGVIANNLFKITPKKEDIYLNKYLFYSLKQAKVREYFDRNQNSTTMPAINFEQVSNLSLVFPTLNVQSSIVEILSSLDDKIELNNKINQELESLAQLLFKRWFVDFEFPNENGEPYKSSGGEMVDSELGEIPREWGLVKIADLKYKLETGTRPKGGVGGITSGVPSVGAESVKGLGKYDYSKIKYVSDDFASKMKRGSIQGYELLIYKDGGKPGTFIPHFTIFGEGYPFERFFINEHVFLLDFFDKDFNSFCYFFFDSFYVKPILENNGGKAAIPGINQEDVKNLRIFNPENVFVKNYGEFAKSIVQTILLNCKENLQLANLRDTLLPKLISGELEIKEN